jgi:hypothetical protein
MKRRGRHLVGLALLANTALVAAVVTASNPSAAAPPVRGETYQQVGDQAFAALTGDYYDGSGRWRFCVPAECGAGNRDWGADSLTYALILRWRTRHDPDIPAVLTALARTSPDYTAVDGSWSDVPMWDSIAAAEEYDVTRDPVALSKAEAAFRYVDGTHAARFAQGACPAVDYQLPDGGTNRLKTLETDSNYIKAALLLHRLTGDDRYLRRAAAKYAAVRRFFLAADLYTVYVYDDGRRCTQLPGRFFASVNGNMIWAGSHLAAVTGQRRYADQAIATARAVQRRLGDATGVYANLQAENDVAEPLVEAMYELATTGRQAFTLDWLLTAAGAAAPTYARFWAGPVPAAPVSAWPASGGIALRFAAAAVDPAGVPTGTGYWRRATTIDADRHLGPDGSPVTVTFTGRAVAIIGTLGEQCCEAGHARVFVDGVETADRTGIWQNKSSSGRSLPGTVLFAWRWPRPGTHTVEIRPGEPNAKEGGPYFHMTAYQVLR